MGFRTNIKVTDIRGTAVLLFKTGDPDPRNITGPAKTDKGAQPALEPGDFSVLVIAEHAPIGSSVEVNVTARSGERKCSFKVGEGGNLYARCTFRLSNEGEVQ